MLFYDVHLLVLYDSHMRLYDFHVSLSDFHMFLNVYLVGVIFTCFYMIHADY
mgnify:CR=1 FL=1